MCGIAGFVTARPGGPDRALLERMTDAIRHRGPDESGYYQDERASLGHRRLSIIDLATGQQPMSNEDGGLWITYNGEIFNHAGLRPALEAAGHRYRTHCDTETILHAYEQYGPRSLDRFRGMFSFAIWDKNARRLFCARDRLGKKPFYYYWDGRLFAFASEIKALLEHPAISPRFEGFLLPEYLAFGYISEERTLFSGIRKLMPGHYLTLDVSGDEPRLETAAVLGDPGRRGSEAAQRCRMDPRVPRAPRRNRADAAHERRPAGHVSQRRPRFERHRRAHEANVHGAGEDFRGGIPGGRIQRTFLCEPRGERIGTEHHEVSIGMEDFFHALPRLVWHEDEPIVWPSSVSLYFVSKLAAEQVKVVLTGEGSDELFAGYGRYRFYEWNARWGERIAWLPAPLRRAIRSLVEASPLLGAGVRRKLQHTFLGLGEDLESLYLDNFYSAFPASEQAGLFPRLKGASAYGNFTRYWDERPSSPPLARMLFADQKTYLVELLMKQDQMSMATSIESRVPFLDHEFVEFSTRVPAHLKLRNGEGKYIVKKAVEDLLPADIVYRKKMGFPTPLRQWLLDPRADRLFQMLEAPDGLLAEYIDGGQLRDAHRAAEGAQARRHRPHLASAESASLGRPVPHRRPGPALGRASPAGPRHGMKILWVNTHFLHPATRGGEIRTLEMLRRLHARHEIHYVAIEDPLDPEGPTRASEYSTRAYPFRHRIAVKRSPWELARGLFDPMPVDTRRFYSPALRQFLEQLMARERFDRQVADSLHATSCFPDLEHSLLFQHNVETIVWGRHAQLARGFARRWYLRAQANRMFEYERQVCQRAGHIAAVSEQDAETMRRLFGVTRVSAIPTGVDIESLTPPDPPPARTTDLVFVGSMDWLPNIDGVEWFAAEVLPLILYARPECYGGHRGACAAAFGPGAGRE